MIIELSDFVALFPKAKNPDQWVAALNKWLPQYAINTEKRVIAFLAQCGHESGGFTTLVENLNYSAKALTATWPKRFPPEIAEKYARKPEMIANRAYANRMGNGPEESGDGWRFRGAGGIQLTGCDNQGAFAAHAGIKLAAVGAYLQTIEGAIHGACWFWSEHNCNRHADAGNFVALTKSINGGTIGLDDRLARLKMAQNVIGTNHVA